MPAGFARSRIPELSDRCAGPEDLRSWLRPLERGLAASQCPFSHREPCLA